MKLLNLLVFCCLSLASYAGKPYTISIKILELGSGKPLEGIEVSFSDEEDKSLFKAVTDKEGKASYPDCTEKTVEITASDPKGNHQDDHFYFSREYNDPNAIVIRLSLSKELERELIASKTAKVEDTTALTGKADCSDSLIIAEFTGGIPELKTYLSTTIRYPETAMELGISGKCYLKFYIDKEGVISGITVMRGVPDCRECDEESIRVIAYMPNWKPAMCNGEAVSSYYTLPITYKLQ